MDMPPLDPITEVELSFNSDGTFQATYTGNTMNDATWSTTIQPLPVSLAPPWAQELAKHGVKTISLRW